MRPHKADSLSQRDLVSMLCVVISTDLDVQFDSVIRYAYRKSDICDHSVTFKIG